MPRTHTGICVALLVSLAWTGGCQPPPQTRLDQQLIGEVMMHSEFTANLRALSVPGGRLSGSPNGHQAEQYVADKLRAYRLENVHFEPFEMTTWRDHRTVVTVLDDPPVVLEGALALGNSLSTPPEGITAELVDVGEGEEEDFRTHGGKLPGKFALVRESHLHRGRKMRLALEHGAAGLVQISKLEDRPRVGTCHPGPRPEPGVVITGHDGETLAKRLAERQTVRLNVLIEADAWPCRPNNVVAEIRGTCRQAGEIVMVSAHLDSWHLGEGAVDNGNGAATILETVRALARSGWKPRRTVRFIWFMGEEHGLFGSAAYVQEHAAELDRVVAVINMDMPGAPRKLATFGHAEVIDFLQSVRRQLVGYELDPEIANGTWGSSDHAPFMKEGVCALGVWGELGPGAQYYHSAGDAFEQVDLQGTTQSAAVLAVLVRRLADCPRRPSVRLDPAKVKAELGE